MAIRLIFLLLFAGASQAATLRFAVVADPHVTKSAAYTPPEPTNCWEYITTNFAPNFVLFFGDLTDTGTAAEFTTVTNGLTLFGAIPVYKLAGNHDYGYPSTFQTTNYFNAIGYSNVSFTAGNYTFAGFDARWADSGGSEGYVTDATLGWLGQTLTNDARPKILFGHYPMQDWPNYQLTNTAAITGLLPTVAIYLYGHNNRGYFSNSVVTSTSTVQINNVSTLSSSIQAGYDYRGAFAIYTLSGTTLTGVHYAADAATGWPPLFTNSWTVPEYYVPDASAPRVVMTGSATISGNVRMQ